MGVLKDQPLAAKVVISACPCPYNAVPSPVAFEFGYPIMGCYQEGSNLMVLSDSEEVGLLEDPVRGHPV